MANTLLVHSNYKALFAKYKRYCKVFQRTLEKKGACKCEVRYYSEQLAFWLVFTQGKI